MRTDILIVEDSPTQAAQLEEALRARGYETQTAANGSEALEIVRRRRPALVLSDVMMPVMDGFQLCRAIKQDPDLCRIPVILLTSLSSPADVLSALEAGADFHIPKPYQADYLLRKIDAILASGSESACEESGTTETVTLDGTTYKISASREHVLRLLLSTYEVAIQQNRELLSAREELRSQNVILEKKVRERTANLMAEMAERGRAEWALRERMKERTCLYAVSRCLQEDLTVDELCRRTVESLVPAMQFPEITVPVIELKGKRYTSGNYTEGLSHSLHSEIRLEDEAVGHLRVSYVEERPFLIPEEQDLVNGVAESLSTWLERRRADVALRESEARYRAVAQSANLAIVTADSAGNIVDWNPQAETMFGHTAAEVLGQPLTRLMPERHRELHLAGMRRLQSGGESHVIGRSVELEGRRKDSSEFPLELSLAKWKTGEGWFVTGMMADITERKQAEERLRAMAEMLNAAPSSVTVHDFEGRFIYANRRTFEIHGYDEPEFMSLNLHELDVPESEALIAERMRLIAEPGGATFEAAHFRKDGSIIPLEVSVKTVEWNGAPAVLSVATDITERQQTAQALLASGQLWQQTVDAMDDFVCVLSPDSKFLAVNRAIREALAPNGEDLRGKRCFELVHGTNAPIPECPCVKALATKRRESSEYEDKGKQYELFAFPILDEKDVCSSFVHIIRDVTTRKQADAEKTKLEAQFLQAQKMETVGRLAGGIAHDFNNLLTVINGTAELASMDLPDDDPLRTEFEEIRRAGDRAAALTRQLLAFSRKQIMKLEVLNLSTLVVNLQSMLQRLIGEHITLVVAPVEHLGSVMADPGQIEQVVMNLAVNARDAMPNGGTLIIETRDVALDAAYAAAHPSVQPGPHVMLAVSDTGVGMDEATRTRIFEPFFTTKDPGKGTGLGLSTVYGIVKQSGGSIWVYSELGKGTAFKIYLPRVEAAAPHGQPAVTVTSVHGTETILIVEDEEAVQHLARRVLQSAGYTVLTASTGREALLVLERHDGPVHLVLTDMVMPGMSGRDLVAQIENISPRMKVLYTSGYTDEAMLHHGLLDGPTCFIGKPYTAAELTRKVREVLDSPDGRPTTG